MTVRSIFVLLLLLCVRPSDARQAEDPYAWDDATIYRIVTDRFSNGDSDNDGAYGRGLDGNGTPYDVDSLGHFLGGDFRGITGWIEDGYFTRLGINTLQISAPYEQVHGWTGQGRTQKYGFDGSMALDYTETDQAFGSPDDFRRLVEAAHTAGIRVLVEVHLAGPGPPTLHDMVELGFGQIRDENWRSWRASGDSEAWTDAFGIFVDSADADSAWAAWWGPDWVRADLPGYEACDGECPPSGTAFKMDSDSLGIPSFLQKKWGSEKTAVEMAELDAWFSRTGYPRVAGYAVVKWVTDWVREFGVDGVVLQDAGHVDAQVLDALKRHGHLALDAYRADRGVRDTVSDRSFWMVGCGDPRSREDSPVDACYKWWNYPASVTRVNAQYRTIADTLADASIIRPVTSIPYSYPVSPRSSAESSGMESSSPESGAMDEDPFLPEAVQLLLAPGPVSYVFGQEIDQQPARRSQPSPTMMNWVAADDSVRAVWQKIGAFRAAHPAVARGGHEVLAQQPLTFFRGVRIGQEVDRVLVVMGADDRTRLNVARIWPDDVALRDAMTGNIALVTFGQVTFTPGPSGILLIEELPE